MSYVGIIAEFNPFTNGHEYIINEAKKQTGLDVICIMSGNLVQRGEMACLDKYTRATHAIKAGASMVFELPTAYALSSADDFGKGAVKCLNELKEISHLAFGIETNNIEFLEKVAKFKAKESLSFKNNLKAFIKLGDSYSVASYKAYLKEFPKETKSLDELFSNPNNILALTYLSAIYKHKLKITPVYVKRQDNGYNSFEEKEVLIDNTLKTFASATHIREMVKNEETSTIKKVTPSYVFEDLQKMHSQDYKNAILIAHSLFVSAIRNKTCDDLKKLYDYKEGLPSLIFKESHKNGSFEEIVTACTSKAYRENRIRKILTYAYMELSQNIVDETKKNISVLNILACKESYKNNLRDIKRKAVAKIIISNSDFISLSSKEKEILSLNQKGTDLHNLANQKPTSIDKAIFVR